MYGFAHRPLEKGGICTRARKKMRSRRTTTVRSESARKPEVRAMREALEAPRALGVDTRTPLELFKRDVRPRGSREDSRSRKHSTPTLELAATQAETRSRTTSASGGNDYAIGGCRLFPTAMEDVAPHGGGTPRRRRDGGAPRTPRRATRGIARTCMRVLTFAGALVGTARAGTSRIRCCLGSLRAERFASAARSARLALERRGFESGRRRSIASVGGRRARRTRPRSASPARRRATDRRRLAR
jgi:hypothetical protein